MTLASGPVPSAFPNRGQGLDDEALEVQSQHQSARANGPEQPGGEDTCGRFVYAVQVQALARTLQTVQDKIVSDERRWEKGT